MIKLLYFIPTYILFLLLRTVLIAIGLVLVPLMAALHPHTTTTAISKVNGREILVWKHKFMWLWSNDEDGIMGAMEFKDRSDFIRIVYWSAIRNPVNNLRFVPFLSLKINPSKIKYVTSTVKDFNGNILKNPTLTDYDRDDLRYTTLIWQGVYSNFRCQFKLFNKIWRFWIGFKIHIHDTTGISSDNYRYNGAGFATQLKRIYPRENK